jgi:hypothetical protein
MLVVTLAGCDSLFGLRSLASSNGPLGDSAAFDSFKYCLPTKFDEAVTFLFPLVNSSDNPVVVDSMKLTESSEITVIATKVVELDPSGEHPGAEGAAYPIIPGGAGAEWFDGATVHDLPMTLESNPAKTGFMALFAISTEVSGSSAAGVDILYHQGESRYELKAPSEVELMIAPDICA